MTSTVPFPPTLGPARLVRMVEEEDAANLLCSSQGNANFEWRSVSRAAPSGGKYFDLMRGPSRNRIAEAPEHSVSKADHVLYGQIQRGSVTVAMRCIRRD